jgi:hypothetical protein
MLDTERDADYCDTQQQSEKQMRQADPDAADQYPDNIHNNR